MNRLSKPERCPDALWEIICSCFEIEPNKRPTFAVLAQKLSKLEGPAKEIPKEKRISARPTANAFYSENVLQKSEYANYN